MKNYSGFKAAPHLYASFDKIKFDILGPTDFQNNDAVVNEFKISNPYSQDIQIDQDKFELNYQFYNGKKRVGHLKALNIPPLVIPAQHYSLIPQIKIPIPKDKSDKSMDFTHIGFCIENAPWPHSSVLRKFTIIQEN